MQLIRNYVPIPFPYQLLCYNMESGRGSKSKMCRFERHSVDIARRHTMYTHPFYRAVVDSTMQRAVQTKTSTGRGCAIKPICKRDVEMQWNPQENTGQRILHYLLFTGKG